MLVTMQALGMIKSFSRPGVGDDNPFIDSFFRHRKYAPSYPTKEFIALDEARAWVKRFIEPQAIGQKCHQVQPAQRCAPRTKAAARRWGHVSPRSWCQVTGIERQVDIITPGDSGTAVFQRLGTSGMVKGRCPVRSAPLINAAMPEDWPPLPFENGANHDR